MSGTTTLSRHPSLRHPDHDYATPGRYFVTACTQDRRWLFGAIRDGTMGPSLAGEIVTAAWHQLSDIFPGIMLDAFQLMPDHIHGVIVLGTEPELPALHTLGEVMRDFKGRSTTWCYAAARCELTPRLDGRVWQRGYHDRIVRSERELEHIRTYIAGNPGRWLERQHG